MYDAITLIDEHQCFELIEASADPNFRKLLDDDNQIYSSIGFDPKSKIERDWTCLHVAVECNVLSVVTMLLDNGAKVENKDQKGNTPLHWAAIRGRFDCIDELLKHNASVTVQNNEGQTPLHLAALAGYTTIVDKLLTKNSSHIETTTIKGWTPLHYACYFGQDECCNYLLNKNANINSMDLEQMTPLHKAIIRGSLPIVKNLILCQYSPGDGTCVDFGTLRIVAEICT